MYIYGWAFGIVAGAAVWEWLRTHGWSVRSHPLTPVFASIGWFCEEIHRFNDFLIYLFPVRRLRMLRTMELWAWWSYLKLAYADLPNCFALRHFQRKAVKMTYTVRPDNPSAYIFLDKFDRKNVERFYAGNVGGYTRHELIELQGGKTA